MRVKVPPARLRYDSLSAHTDQTWYLAGEAAIAVETQLVFVLFQLAVLMLGFFDAS